MPRIAHPCMLLVTECCANILFSLICQIKFWPFYLMDRKLGRNGGARLHPKQQGLPFWPPEAHKLMHVVPVHKLTSFPVCMGEGTPRTTPLQPYPAVTMQHCNAAPASPHPSPLTSCHTRMILLMIGGMGLEGYSSYRYNKKIYDSGCCTDFVRIFQIDRGRIDLHRGA